ncbi:MAG: NifU family protein [Pirellulaceae bacterium]
MNTDEIKILAEPLTNLSCRFSVDRPVYPEASYYFDSPAKAEGAPLAAKLFALEGIVACLIAHDAITVHKSTPDDWPDLARQIGTTIREHMGTGEAAVSDELREQLPPAEEIRARVQQVLDTEINPNVAAHGGVVQLLEVRENNVFVQLGGGCQGCGMANVTLRHGVETAIRKAVPEVGAICDATDHAAGRSPFYASSRE